VNETNHTRRSAADGLRDAVIEPTDGSNGPEKADLGKFAVMVSGQADLKLLGGQLRFSGHSASTLFSSKLHRISAPGHPYAVVGPIIGAPYAVMVLEKLVARGAVKLLFFGWCGAISPSVKIGDIIVSTGAIVDEGTSRHYAAGMDGALALPSPLMVDEICRALNDRNLDFHKGDVWTTDAVYRETTNKIATYQKQNALAVEMELSALFTVGRFRKVDVGGILVVSDELSTMTWKPGFSHQRFKNTRKRVCEAIQHYCENQR